MQLLGQFGGCFGPSFCYVDIFAGIACVVVQQPGRPSPLGVRVSGTSVDPHAGPRFHSSHAEGLVRAFDRHAGHSTDPRRIPIESTQVGSGTV